MKEVKAYKCEFCGKLYQRKHFCEKHERGCWKNPDNFSACFNCEHYEKPQYVDYGESNYEDIQFISHYCKLNKKEMLSGKQLVKGGRVLWEYEDGEGTDVFYREKMPTECNDQVRKYKDFWQEEPELLF